MTHWYLSTPQGPICFRNGGRTVGIAKQTWEVTTWKQEGAAHRNCDAVNAAPLSHMKPATVRPFTAAAVHVEITDAEKRRHAGADEARRLMSDLAAAERNVKLAPFTVEAGAARIKVTVETAAAELVRAQDAMTVGAADPLIKRWL